MSWRSKLDPWQGTKHWSQVTLMSLTAVRLQLVHWPPYNSFKSYFMSTHHHFHNVLLLVEMFIADRRLRNGSERKT